MAKYYAPNFSGLLPLFDGQSAAGGKLYAYRAGSSIPAPLFDEDGVELGSWVSIDSNGCASFLLDSALSYKLVAKDALGAVVGEWDNVKATNAPGGMDNPMTAPGDMIVGGDGGEPEALPCGDEGNVLMPVDDGNGGTTPGWVAGDEVFVPLAGTKMGHPITGQVYLEADDSSTGFLQLNPYGAIEIGTIACHLQIQGSSSSDFRSTLVANKSFLLQAINGVAEIAASGDASLYSASRINITAKHDIHIASPNTGNIYLTPAEYLYLSGKLCFYGEATYITSIKGCASYPDSASLPSSLTESNKLATESGVQKMIELNIAGIPAQPGDHQLLVSATDAAAGYLGAKLTAGSNVTLTPQTDGDGVQTLEISATGGGGGGAKEIRQTIFKPYIYLNRTGVAVSYIWVFAVEPLATKVTGFSIYYASNTLPNYVDCAIYEGLARSNATKVTAFSRSNITLHGTTGVFVGRGTFTTPVDLDLTKNHWVAFLSGPTSGSSLLTYGEQLYGTVTNSTYPIGSMQNITSLPAALTSLNDSDGKMPGFMLHYEV